MYGVVKTANGENLNIIGCGNDPKYCIIILY